MADETPESGLELPTGRLLWIGGGIAAVLLVLGLVYWMVVPRVADTLVRERLTGIEQRAGVTADYRTIETSATEGVKLNDFRIRREGADSPLVEVDEARARLSLYHLAFGEPVVSSIEVRDAVLRVRRGADGRTNLERILAQLRSGSDDRDASGGAAGQEDGPGLLRYFGGVWPDATVENASLEFASANGAAPWPVRKLSVETMALDSSGTTATVTGNVAVEPGPGGDPRWQLPETVDLDGTLRLPIARSTGTVAFQDSLQLVGVGPLPFLRTGLSALRIDEDATVELRGLSLAMQADGKPRSFGAADRLLVSFAEWPTSLADIDLRRIVLDRPKVVAHVDRQHGSAIQDLIQLTRAPVARRVASRAKFVARDMYLDIPRWRRPDLDGDDEEDGDASSDDAANGGSAKSERADDSKPSIADRIRELVTSDIVARLAPREARVKRAEIHLTDDRRLGLQRPADSLGLRSGSLVFRHEPDSGTVEVRGGFDAYSGESTSRGSVSVEVGGNFRKGTVEGSAQVETLDLSWLSQMCGASVARRIRGGALDAEFESRRNTDENRHEFSGHVQLEGARLAFEHLAQKPVDDLTTGYAFEGYYAPDADLPAPEHIAWKHLSPDDRLEKKKEDAPAGASPARGGDSADASSYDGPPDDAVYPTRGAVVFTEGRATLNGVSARVRPALYGLDGLRSLPARFDLQVGLEETPVQTLFEAVPKAIRGPVADAKMQGSFAWDFDVEIPLYNAGEMEWSAEPKLRAFKLKSLPSGVDVREMESDFSHQIDDPAIEFHRRVDIPKMRPVSARFLIDHCELSVEELDERRRRRGWPPLPAVADLGPNVSTSVRQTPRVWLTDAAEGMAASKPWSRGQPLATIDRGAIPPGTSPVEYAKRQIRRDRRKSTETEETPSNSSGPSPSRSTGRDSSPASSGGAFGFGPFPGSQTDDVAPSSSRPEPRPLDRSILVTKNGRRRVHPYGPYVYVPLHHMSKWLPRTVMTTEDNSFFEHDGFNWFALEESLEENIAAGGFVRGGSTISMQLVKNVYLSFDKVLARKLREAFLVWIMEEVVDVPKARILELYFNVIEFGPGIFGIHDAAVHYFGKRPDQLSLSEVLFLISIVPNPKEYHRYYEHGKISDSWFDSMTTYAEIMQSRDRATAKDVSRVKNNRPTFYKPSSGEPKLRPSAREPKQSQDAPSIEDFSKIFQ